MNASFEELDYAKTPLGELILRRRRVLSLDQDVYEVKLNDSFLMSSLVKASEIALADRCLEKLTCSDMKVAVGGLGLGYTAHAALSHRNVGSLLVIEYLSAIIGWHERGLVPLGASLTDDNRCKFVNADFFSLASNPQQGLDLEYPGRRFDAILVDIDHTPDYLLDEASSNFYSENGLATLARHLEPNGVFGLWSAGEPDDSVVNRLETCFESAEASVVEFTNPLLSLDDRNTIYIGISPS
ncbi:spermidine synthase [bacterium]|jgi:spermidine synthase|nr:spermidine synthase [bacterium]HCK08750.1 spermidine synthase [Candidatus Latescibacterota bacterium]